jgi:uncharacterized membrane-anchored protein YhcB (DUF1043 family)
MVILIPAPDRVLRGRSPIVGVPSEAEATALTIARMQQEIDATYDQTAQAVKSLIFLSGAAVSALIDRLEHSLLPGIARLSDDLFAASRAFHRYAEEVAQIHAQAEATLERVSQDLREIDVASHELREAGEVLHTGLNRHRFGHQSLLNCGQRSRQRSRPLGFVPPLPGQRLP